VYAQTSAQDGPWSARGPISSFTREDAVVQILADSGKEFDPSAVPAFVKICSLAGLGQKSRCVASRAEQVGPVGRAAITYPILITVLNRSLESYLSEPRLAARSMSRMPRS
jgi:hypothetical protein